MTTKEFEIDQPDLLAKLYGVQDRNFRRLMGETGVFLNAKDGNIVVSGEEDAVELACTVLKMGAEILRRGGEWNESAVRYAVSLAREKNTDEFAESLEETVAFNMRGKPIRCKTLSQREYVSSIRKNSLVFGIGPAGTGKTYLAVALAVRALKNGEVQRLILTRPAIEAGEKLGFLPGDMAEKVDPYLRPLYDALADMLGVEGYQKLIEKGVIEIAPLAFMRGRTLSDSFIILDEAQNTTCEQMKMVLTRIGEGSKMVVNGDLTQIDLPKDKPSGLKQAEEVFRDAPEKIRICTFGKRDVVRCDLVSDIVACYDRFESSGRSNKKTVK